MQTKRTETVRHSFSCPEIVINLPEDMIPHSSLFDFHAECEKYGYYCYQIPVPAGATDLKKAGYYIMEIGNWLEQDITLIEINGKEYAFFEAVNFDEVKGCEVVRAAFITARDAKTIIANVFYCAKSDYNELLFVFRECMFTFCSEQIGEFKKAVEPQLFNDKLFSITLSNEFEQESSLLKQALFKASNCCGVKVFMEYVRFVAVLDDLQEKKISSVFDYEKWLAVRKKPSPKYSVLSINGGQVICYEETTMIGDSYKVSGINYVYMGKNGFFALRTYCPEKLLSEYAESLRKAAYSVILQDDDVRGFSDEGMNRLALPQDTNPYS